MAVQDGYGASSKDKQIRVLRTGGWPRPAINRRIAHRLDQPPNLPPGPDQGPPNWYRPSTPAELKKHRKMMNKAKAFEVKRGYRHGPMTHDGGYFSPGAFTK